MVTEDRLVKVLDIGLAKLTQPAPADNLGLTKSTESMTQPGAIVGTAAYMSLEQAEGKPVDARSDIFTFGAVLYEMITGRRAFKGDSNISTLAAILHEEPEPVGRIATGIPQELERIIAGCLEKDPEQRRQSMAEVGLELQQIERELDLGGCVRAEAKPWKRGWLWIAAALVILSVGWGV